MEVRDLADGVLALCGPISNSGVVDLGGGRAVVIDTQSGAEPTEHLRGLLRDRNLDATVVNTHHHWDHTTGNPTFSGCSIICSGYTRQALRSSGPTYWEPSHHVAQDEDMPAGWPGLPDLALSPGQTLTVHGPARSVEIHCLGRPAHTGGDIVVRVSDSGVVFLGDLWFNGLHPAIDQSGDIAGWLAALDALMEPGACSAVGGHGPVGRLTDLAPLAAYFREVLDSSPDASPPARVDWPRAERHEQLLRHAGVAAGG